MNNGRNTDYADLTVLFTDIAGSTLLIEDMGDAQWFDVLRRHNAIVRAHVAVTGGREIKTQGDGFLLAFDRAGAAVECAVGIQRSMHHVRSPRTGEQVQVRIGGDAGDVRVDNGDLFGLHVHLAAKIAQEANGGEIIVSDSVRARVGGSPGGGSKWGASWTAPLRGVRAPVDVVEVDWQRPAAVVAMRPALMGRAVA